MTQPTTAGDAYDAVLLAGLREHVFDLEDYDAEAAAREVASEIPPFGRFVRERIAEESSAGKENQP